MKIFRYKSSDGTERETIYYDLGDKVSIIRQDIFHLKHRKIRTGVITRVLSSDVFYVRPSWCKWEIELYACEIEPV